MEDILSLVTSIENIHIADKEVKNLHVIEDTNENLIPIRVKLNNLRDWKLPDYLRNYRLPSFFYINDTLFMLRLVK